MADELFIFTASLFRRSDVQPSLKTNTAMAFQVPKLVQNARNIEPTSNYILQIVVDLDFDFSNLRLF